MELFRKNECGKDRKSSVSRKGKIVRETLKTSPPRKVERVRERLKIKSSPVAGKTVYITIYFFSPQSRGHGGRNGRAESRARPFPSPSPVTRQNEE